jgi:hypothetical protein
LGRKPRLGNDRREVPRSDGLLWRRWPGLAKLASDRSDRGVRGGAGEHPLGGLVAQVVSAETVHPFR